MRFAVEHRFAAPPPTVAAVLVDPDFYRTLELPDVGTPEVLAASTEGTCSTVRLRYEFTGHLDPIARRLLGERRLAWVQELRLDRAVGTGELRFFAEAAPARLHGEAACTLALDGDGTLRRLEGELVVGLPGLRRTAEGRIVPGLLARLDREAEALAARLLT